MSLFDRKLLVLTGKGGVGKTTVASALAVAAARQGKKVIMVEIGARENIAPLFGKKKQAGYKGLKVWSPPKVKRNNKKNNAKGKKKSRTRSRNRGGSVTAMHLDPQSALKEFVVRQVKVELMYRAIFQNRVMRYFTAAAPGLEDLLMLGKIVYLAEGHGGPDWDLVIFDAPATGHNIAFFNSAYAFLQISRVGPMRKRVEGVWSFLKDPDLTAFNVVSLPEEMPVNESVDLWHTLGTEMELPLGVVVANAMITPLFDDDAQRELFESVDDEGSATDAAGRVRSGLVRAARQRQRRRALHERYLGELKDEIDAPTYELPYLFAPDFGLKQVEALAKHLASV